MKNKERPSVIKRRLSRMKERNELLSEVATGLKNAGKEETYIKVVQTIENNISEMHTLLKRRQVIDAQVIS